VNRSFPRGHTAPTAHLSEIVGLRTCDQFQFHKQLGMTYVQRFSGWISCESEELGIAPRSSVRRFRVPDPVLRAFAARRRYVIIGPLLASSDHLRPIRLACLAVSPEVIADLPLSDHSRDDQSESIPIGSWRVPSR
jgi:hypothetical protein